MVLMWAEPNNLHRARRKSERENEGKIVLSIRITFIQEKQFISLMFECRWSFSLSALSEQCNAFIVAELMLRHERRRSKVTPRHPAC